MKNKEKDLIQENMVLAADYKNAKSDRFFKMVFIFFFQKLLKFIRFLKLFLLFPNHVFDFFLFFVFL